ncbi:MAG: alkaline phosphatase family protein [Candidatus Acidiferrum sp.]
MGFPASIARALAIPANDETGSIHDVKHVVVMMQDRSFDIFREDVLADRLPQVSWIVAPEAYTEHGNWPSNFGARYVSGMLDALTAKQDSLLPYVRQERWLLRPHGPAHSAKIIYRQRYVPRLCLHSRAVRPQRARADDHHLALEQGWRVNSQVFDHNSLIRHLEQRFGVLEPNITPAARLPAT